MSHTSGHRHRPLPRRGVARHQRPSVSLAGRPADRPRRRRRLPRRSTGPKHFGTSPSTSSAATPGLPGGQGIPSGFPALGGAGTTQPSSAASATGQQAASLIGTVTRVKGNTLQVKDFGGTIHTVTIGPHTSITRLATLRAGDIKPGSTVVIEQGAGSAKRHPATSITVR